MIDKLKYILIKIFEKPYRIHETILPTEQSEAYTEMVSNDLEEKYDGRLFEVPIQLINFDAILQILSGMGHPAIKSNVTEPYSLEDFHDLEPEIAEIMTDYMNTHLKLLVNSVVQEYLESEKIKMSADEGGIKYYTEEDDEDIDALIELEQAFRTI